MPKNRKRLFCGVLLMLVWLSFVVEGSHALLNTNSFLTNNMVTVGQGSLVISNSQSATATSFSDSATGFSYTLAPGSGEDKYVLLKNASVQDLPLDLYAYPTVKEGDDAIMSATNLNFSLVDGEGKVLNTPVGSSIKSLTSNAPISLKIQLAKGEIKRIKIHTSLAASFSQGGKTTKYDVTFSGVQHELTVLQASQPVASANKEVNKIALVQQ